MSYLGALATLANPTRRSLFDRVRKRPQTVGELALQVPVSQPAVSQHLRRLRDAGLVEERREGTRHYFHASPEGLARLRADLESLWDDVLTAYADAPQARRAEREKKTRKKREPR